MYPIIIAINSGPLSLYSVQVVQTVIEIIDTSSRQSYEMHQEVGVAVWRLSLYQDRGAANLTTQWARNSAPEMKYGI